MKTAVVIGSSIAGLCAARTLSDRFDRVVVLDRDELPDSATPRKGVPQSGHGHVLLVAGQRAMDELFPGLTTELVERGAVQFDPGMDLSFYRFGAIWPRVPSKLRLVSCSRPLLELTIRRHVLALDGVEVRDRTAVSALLGTGDKVTGVRLDDDTVIDTDLVVDCSGRGGRSNQWLTTLGFPVPEVTEVKIGVGYGTRFYRREEGDFPTGKAIFALPTPPLEFRVGLALPVEDNRWLVSLGGWHDSSPRDEEGFQQHARELPHPGIAKLMESCEPLTELELCGYPSSRRRHFEALSRVPAGYLTLGDAICSFNPIYGQGMTCAALEALELGVLLDKHDEASAKLAVEFYQQASRIISTPWQFATGGDFVYPQTKGVRPKGIGLFNAYSRQIQLASIVDPHVRDVFNAVQHLILDPSALRTPEMLLRVLRQARRARRTIAA